MRIIHEIQAGKERVKGEIMELQGKKAIFLGDSITEGVGASCPKNRYVSVFAKMSGIEVKNYGISGYY